MSKRGSIIWEELESHLPYSVFATASGIILAGILLFMAMVSQTGSGAYPLDEPAAPETHVHGSPEEVTAGAAVMEHASHVIFHVFHPVHMLLSAIATTAMFWRHERKWVKAVVVGVIGAAVVCSVSDVLLPYLSGALLGAGEMRFHWCLLDHPSLVVSFMLVGVVVGIFAAETVQRSTYFSHAAHVFVSSAASLFYLVSFGLTEWPQHLGAVFVLMLVAVTLPCCFSDIAFPLMVSREAAEGCECGHRHH